jgi:hypothetical protein
METIVVQVNNGSAFRLLENLEALNVIKMLPRIPYLQADAAKRTTNGSASRQANRLHEIQAITKNINVDLTNFKFNRDEATNYDE